MQFRLKDGLAVTCPKLTIWLKIAVVTNVHLSGE